MKDNLFYHHEPSRLEPEPMRSIGTNPLGDWLISDKLPSPKGVALTVLELCSNEQTSYAELAHVAQLDPALAGRLIKQANSAHRANHRPVVSITEAIARLGLTTVRNLALGFSLIDEYRDGPCRAFDYEEFWSHSLLMALAMQHLATPSGTGSPDELFACGLLARIGCLALATMHPVEYSRLLDARDDERPLTVRERDSLHTDHNELTAALLLRWGIPAALTDPIYHHENPPASAFPLDSRQHRLCQLFHLAKGIGDLGLAPDPKRSGLTTELLLLSGQLGLNAEEFGKIVDNLVDQWQEWGKLLNTPAAVLPPFTQMTTTSLPPQEPGRLQVLLASADKDTTSSLVPYIEEQLGHFVVAAEDNHQALALAIEMQPQLVIVDHCLPKSRPNLDICQALRENQWGQAFYILLLTSKDISWEEISVAGVDDFIIKPVLHQLLHTRFQVASRYIHLLETWQKDRAQLNRFAAEVAISNRQLRHAAMTDPLTGLANRRAGMDALNRAWHAALRSALPLSVLLLDVDHFKGINDRYGHAIGDHVLRDIAQVMQQAARQDESISRIGGEEFLVVCHNADPVAAWHAAERMRRLVETLELSVEGATLHPTLSIGAATMHPGTPDTNTLVRDADRALYRAKQAGRNRVCLSAGGRLFLDLEDLRR